MKYHKMAAAALVAFSACITQPAWSANWLMLQGTEHPKAKKDHRFWGFIQPTYTNDKSPVLKGLTGGFSTNNGFPISKGAIAPDFEDSDGLYISRARFGVRGKFTGALKNDFTSKMNYFVFFEAASNLMTHDFGADSRARLLALDHLSVTFNHIKGARIRAGLFKTPGPEETFAAINLQNYIEFTDFTAREMLERFVTGNEATADYNNFTGASGTDGRIGTPDTQSYGFNAARDWGIQVFDSFKTGKWDLSYAIMIGRGEGIHEGSDSDDNKELYLYGSAEYDLPGGRGPRKNGVKLYAWSQKGKREFESDPTHKEYDRHRYGIGVVALGKLFGGQYKHRVGLDLSYANGMIFAAPLGNVVGGGFAGTCASAGQGPGCLQYAVEKGNKAKGVTFDYGFYLNKNWEFDFRYHRNNLLYDVDGGVHPASERVITEKTYGIQYHFNPKVRLAFNYMDRDAKFGSAAYTNPGIDSNVRTIVDTLDDRIGIQLTWIFN